MSACTVCRKPATQRRIRKIFYLRCEEHMADLYCSCGNARTHEVVLQDGQLYNLCRRCVMVSAGHDDVTARNCATPETVQAALDLIAAQLRNGVIPDPGGTAAAMLAEALARKPKGGAS